MYTIKNNNLSLFSDNLLQSFKQIYVLNTYVFWLALINFYKYQKTQKINLKLNNTIFLLYKYNTKFIKFNIKFSYILTKHVSKVFTLLRSPMAQKKFSKEQVGFRYYNINFKIIIDTDYFKYFNINLSKLHILLYFILLLKEEFYVIFCGLFLFHGFNIYFYTKYFFNLPWRPQLR